MTGNAGSGKSTLGRIVAQKKSLPLFSLDSIVWREGWQKATSDEVRRGVSNLISKRAWVIDGVDYEILKAADVVIFLDFPRKVSFYRAAIRNRKFLFTSRPDLPANCPEILIIPKLIKIIWKFPKRVRPKILAEKIRRGDTSFVHIQNNKQLKEYLDSL